MLIQDTTRCYKRSNLQQYQNDSQTPISYVTTSLLGDSELLGKMNGKTETNRDSFYSLSQLLGLLPNLHNEGALLLCST